MTTQAEQIRQLRRERAELRRHLRDLTRAVKLAVDALDAEMVRPTSSDRGRRIAAITSTLQLANDMAKRFGLAEKT